MREIKLGNEERIGGGVSGSVYRYGEDKILKVYANSFKIEEVESQYNISTYISEHGIRTAKTYEMVKVGDSFGIVSEFIAGRTLSRAIAAGEEVRIEAAQKLGKILRQLHNLPLDDTVFPPLREMFNGLLERCGSLFTEDEKKIFLNMIDDFPGKPVVIHGDFHENNIIVQPDGYCLIDLDSMCIGSPLFEFMQIYCVYQNELPTDLQKILKLTPKESEEFLYRLMEVYFDTTDRKILDNCHNVFTVLGDLNRFIARFLTAKEEDYDSVIEYKKENFQKLVDRINGIKNLYESIPV
jgi:uncharacterized protein (TIGR02172 family)